MHARLMTSAAVILACVLLSGCWNDARSGESDESAAKLVQVGEPQEGAQMVNHADALPEAPKASAAQRPETAAERAASQEARAVVAKIGQPDQPAGW